MTSSKRILLLQCLFIPIFACLTVGYQINFMGLEWYEEVQWQRTQTVLAGGEGTPWQYRLFTESIVYCTVHAFEAVGVDRPVGVAFVLIRILQNTLAFTLLIAFCRMLGLTRAQGMLGVTLLGWGMCHALYDGDLTFNTYTDMSIFLTAGLLIGNQKFRWLLLLMCIAPFNRETSGCIPFMLLFSQVQWKGGRPTVSREVLILFITTLTMWISVVGGLRIVYGVRPYIVPTAGVEPIWPLLKYNLTWYRTWVFLFATLGLMPLLALVSWKAWPQLLKRFFWAVVPVWFPIHFSLAHAPESRLFLVPQVLIFIPGALLGMVYFQSQRNEAVQSQLVQGQSD